MSEALTQRDKNYHVIVDFGSAIPASIQGEVMFAMEKNLRERGLPAEVLKKTMVDDSKLRNMMTPTQRAKL
jgi:hypothetical protein